MSEGKSKAKVHLVHSKTMRLGTVNLDTGEILEGIQIQQKSPIKIKHFSQDYIIMFLRSFENVAKDEELRGVTTAVLLYLVSKTQMKNWVQIQQKEIAEALNMKIPHVSRALKKLEEKGVIEATAKLGKGKSYRISIDFGWRGPGKEYADEKALRIVKARRECLDQRSPEGESN